MALDSVTIDRSGFNGVFNDRRGVVGRDLDKRATRVMMAAKAQAGYKTGRLRADISKQWMPSRPGRLTIRVGSGVRHALVHHEGARPHVIRAKNAKMLRYINRDGHVVFAQSVNHPGHRANQYLTDNLRRAL